MRTRMVYLCSFILALSMAASASAGLIAQWKLDEGTGNTTVEEVSKKAANVINATWTKGLFPNSRAALDFNGSNAYVNVVGQDWGTFKQVSLAVWLKFDTLPGAYNAIFHEDWVSGGIHFMVRSSGVVGFSLNGRGGNDFNSQGVLKAGEIYHVVATFDLATGHTEIYINGVLDAEGNGSPTATSIFFRSPFTIGSWNTDRYWDGVLDDLRLYDYVVTPAEIPTIMAGAPRELAMQPQPENEQIDIVREPVLSWVAGAFAATHDVYLGTAFNDVNTASRSDPRGVLASQGQAGTTYDPSGRLAFGTTYYWRIDEVNAPPTSTIFKGKVWSFTTEPVAYPVDGATIKATASSASDNQGPQNTINGSGLTNDLHATDPTTMWLTAPGTTGPAWILYEFPSVLRLHEMWVWNQNGLLESVLGVGAKDVTIEYSVNGTDFTTLGTTYQFARGTGKTTYTHGSTVDLARIAAKYVRLTITSNWGGILPQYGLSEVRFFSVPVFAREPSPASGTTGVVVDTALSWRSGREAGQHQILLGMDPNTLAPVATTTAPSGTPALNLDTTYYWKVVEVNNAETPSTWAGAVWNFKTEPYSVVDDFESYTDDMDAGQAIFQTWADGYGIAANGSLVGYDRSPFAEPTIVSSGKQSMPLSYDNTTATSSEATRTFKSPQNWTLHNIKGLTLWFYGYPANVAQQMYVKINSTKILYDGDPANLKVPVWQMWYIDLTSRNVSSVTSLSIGFDRLGGTGGAGKVLIDAIRLYPLARQLVTPADPGTAGLQLQYQFEGNANDGSGKGHNGTLQGGPAFATGKSGQALSFDGLNDYVDIGNVATLSSEKDFTWSAWIKTSTGGTIIARAPATGNWAQGGKALFVFNTGILRVDIGWVSNLSSTVTVNDDQWHLVAMTTKFQTSGNNDTMVLYIDGRQAAIRSNWNVNAYPEAALSMKVGFTNGNFPAPLTWYSGLIDDVRIYDRALSPEEIAGMAGLTVPYDKPF